ncbi:MAG: UPF0175 family protein [Planctomycetes bacterium]|nr:UPF0175 family protein [Planctomycetota bacterium]
MHVTIPDELATTLGANEREVVEELAVALYTGKRITLALAAEFAGVDRIGFQEILGKRGLCLNFSRNEVLEDLRVAAALSGKPTPR